MEAPYFEDVRNVVDFIEKCERMGLRPVIPLLGGAFTGRNCWMGSTCHIAPTRLHEVTFWVLEKSSGMAIGAGPTKAIALAQARKFLSEVSPLTMDKALLTIHEEIQRRAAEKVARLAEESERSSKNKQGERRSIPARRRRVFEKSSGKCHYCGCELDIEGKWHVEHMMPKALGGSDQPGNLVASCVPCNYKKRDQTATEFTSGKRAVEGLA